MFELYTLLELNSSGIVNKKGIYKLNVLGVLIQKKTYYELIIKQHVKFK